MRNLFRTILVAVGLTACAAPAASAQDVENVHITDLKIHKAEDAITVNFRFHPQDYRLGLNNKIRIIPAVISGEDTVMMTPITVIGKNGWYYEVRNADNPPVNLYRAGKGTTVDYSSTIPFEDWMQQSGLALLTDTLSCCGKERPPFAAVGTTTVAKMDYMQRAFAPAFNYVVPLDTIEKRFDLSGRANVRFIVNKINIDWSYANNYVELDSILRTVKVVRDNPDAAVDSIILTGYASPEGPYDNNVYLANGRTEVVKEYVRNNSSFPASVYHTASVPEDWGGLREWLVTSNIDNRDRMIEWIDSYDGPPAPKNDLFARAFPGQYQWLLDNVYPPLRHTDYRITYTVRRYYDVEEIRRVFATYPGNLSLNEFYLLANSYPQGSEEFDAVMRTAALKYPKDPVANLNAALSAIQSGHYKDAEKYLDKLPSSPETDYARGVLYGKMELYDTAREWLEKAARAGVADAAEAIRQLEEMQRSEGKVIYYTTKSDGAVGRPASGPQLRPIPE